ncbi:toll-like receptor 2 [Lingula anatina]|uniref:Toll-like receptor 2 n=1 Tax=Lingula anatina TaxID=7574 RepID=A0A1S3IME7_LINAN|nr:toll-like receptor 2 [Lingula anatina]|eukprot:XP_013399071.1 toll-like receptor 2 [Lingula anatina]
MTQKDLILDNKKFECCDSNSESIPPPPCNAKNKKGKLYDFYVIYSEEDSDWVSKHLLTTLEGTKGFKGCVKERDFIPGTTITDSILESIKNSLKVLVIISGREPKDEWYDFEVRHAIHHRHDSGQNSFVIPICRENANKSDVPLTLRDVNPCYMVSAHDWEKLERALDDDNSQ